MDNTSDKIYIPSEIEIKTDAEIKADADSLVHDYIQFQKETGNN